MNHKIVIKIGTTSIASNNEKGINLQLMSELVEAIIDLKKLGHDVVLVSSGAVGLGSKRLNFKEKPKKITDKQVAASVGQILLASLYDQLFQKHGQIVGQVLLTKQELQNKENFFNAQSTLKGLLALGVIPIINENDVVAVDEIKFTDNDHLAALVCKLISADELFLLTDTEGLFTKNPFLHPDAQLINEVVEINTDIESMVKESRSKWGTGGMMSKIKAAKMVINFGTNVHIISGSKVLQISNILKGERIGTLFRAKRSKASSGNKKTLIAYMKATKGKIFIDEGAKDALFKGKSLLPVGIKEIDGSFKRGEIIEILYKKALIAKGITRYSSKDLEKIKGLVSNKIEDVLSYTYGNNVIHRDDLMII